jgi:hypothetical protein
VAENVTSWPACGEEGEYEHETLNEPPDPPLVTNDRIADIGEAPALLVA